MAIGIRRGDQMNIIGDIHGNYKTFLALIRKMPDSYIVCTGDLIDRGPGSKEIIEWFMTHEDCSKSLMGNHEQMVIDNFKYGNTIFDEGVWFMNGGGITLKSYNYHIPDEVIDWLEKRNYCHWTKDKKYFISHSSLHPKCTLEESIKIAKMMEPCQHNYDFTRNILWNRSNPIRRDYFQIFGHNGYFKRYSDEQGEYAICIDSFRDDPEVLTGVHLETMKVYEQDIID